VKEQKPKGLLGMLQLMA
jgi:hypothetical protein